VCIVAKHSATNVEVVQTAAAQTLLDWSAVSLGYRSWPHALRPLAMTLLGSWLEFGGTISDLAMCPSLLKLPSAFSPHDPTGWPTAPTGLPSCRQSTPTSSPAGQPDDVNCEQEAVARAPLKNLSDQEVFKGRGVHVRAGRADEELLLNAHLPFVPPEDDSQELFGEEQLAALCSGRAVGFLSHGIAPLQDW
jgi:hypothetical protein